MQALSQKESGAYYTPDHVASSLLLWAIRSLDDRLLDPSCGDGRFISSHRNSVGIEQDATAAQAAISRAPWALVHEGDFFAWAANTTERFECAAGNPPFIRYQTFKGDVRALALQLCAHQGAQFSGLASSWAPFLVATASLLKRGGRMAFVVPAEIGHAPYATPLLEYLVSHFKVVHVVAVRDKLFADLSEDCWLLYTEGFGESTNEIRFTALDSFKPLRAPPRRFQRIALDDWRSWGNRLRPFLMSREVRQIYQGALAESTTRRFGDIASIGIGYVTGANDFFHLRPSEVRSWGIDDQWLHPTVRKGSALPSKRLTQSMVDQWRRGDEQILLLRIPKGAKLPSTVGRYLDSAAGHQAREAYKCRVRDPWYSVPDVQVPDFFLSYMSGLEPSLVRNEASCTCTNSVHSVRLKAKMSSSALLKGWESDFMRLSAEIEGHPLGGGMLKLEPREATRIVVPATSEIGRLSSPAVSAALSTMREWRHYAPAQ
ncbi:Eco57I restriction-modification methylase domain-containing protein [Variovorax rhizosphaerae]|uniref:site-specific DNA-methyltransferase (adenine-specific) n=1 Tax=Variovorax rhizosphaerae TaxID=1836200 RepID=A0ABU8WRK7_9BURK